MKDKTKKFLQKQIMEEFSSAYLYLGFAAKLEIMGYKGFAHWFMKQAEEETTHALRISQYLIDLGESIELYEIQAPVIKEDSLSEILNSAYQHEKYITECIDAIYSIAIKEDDYLTLHFLDWFLNEQMEEEKNALDLQRSCMLYGDLKTIYELDRQAGKR